MKIKKLIINKLISETSIKSIGDYTINPYKGCSFGCNYCYVINMRNIKDKDNWGKFVFIKENLEKILNAELENFSKKLEIPYKNRIIIGSSCDPYQPVELIENSTQKILKLLKKYNLPFFLMTKSPLFIKDIELLDYNIKNRICFTINNKTIIKNFENSYSKYFRLFSYFIALTYNLDIYIHYGPYFPYICDIEEFLEELFFSLDCFFDIIKKNKFEFNEKKFYEIYNKKNNLNIINEYNNFVCLLKNLNFDFTSFYNKFSRVSKDELLNKVKINIEILNLKETYNNNIKLIFEKLRNYNSELFLKFINTYFSNDNFNRFIDNLNKIKEELIDKKGIKINILKREFDKFYSEDYFISSS